MYADDYLIIMSGHPAVAKKKLDEIMESMELTMNTEKTRIGRQKMDLTSLAFISSGTMPYEEGKEQQDGSRPRDRSGK